MLLYSARCVTFRSRARAPSVSDRVRSDLCCSSGIFFCIALYASVRRSARLWSSIETTHNMLGPVCALLLLLLLLLLLMIARRAKWQTRFVALRVAHGYNPTFVIYRSNVVPTALCALYVFVINNTTAPQRKREFIDNNDDDDGFTFTRAHSSTTTTTLWVDVAGNARETLA